MNDSIEELRKLNIREFYSPFSRFMHNTMMYVTKPLLKTNITPNEITIAWILIQLAGSLLMVFGTYTFNVIGVILFIGAALLDYVDGQIARIKKIQTYKGIFLEDLGIHLGSPIFFLCLSIGLSHSYGDPRYFLLGVVSALSILYSKLAVVNPQNYPLNFRDAMTTLQQSLSSRAKQNKVIYLFFFFRRSQPLNFLLLGIVFNVPRAVLVVYTILYFLEFTRRMYGQVKRLYHLDKELELRRQKA